MTAERVTFTLPPTHGVFDDLPAWVLEGIATSDWEGQQIRHAFTEADQKLREAIARFAAALNALHAGEPDRDLARRVAADGAHGEAAVAIMGLAAARDGVIHRHALERKAAASRVDASERDLILDLVGVWPDGERVVWLATLVDRLRGLDLMAYSGGFTASVLGKMLESYGISSITYRADGGASKRGVRLSDVEAAAAKVRAAASPAESTEAQQ